MPPKSKYAPSEYRKNANKVFTNREGFINYFNQARNSIQKGKHYLLTFYGVGGEGKSALCRKLIEIIKNEKPKTAAVGEIDFSVEANRRADQALLQLRKSLRDSSNGKIKFPAFDIAITHYWEKEYPQSDVQNSLKNSLDKNEDIIAAALDKISECLYYAEKLDGIGVAFKFINKLINKGKKAYFEIEKESLHDLKQLKKHELLQKLPYIFASDILCYLKKEKQLNVVFCLDTYEALWEHSQIKTGPASSLTDNWVKDLVRELPGVLFIFFGREKLTWDEDCPDEWANYLNNQHQLHGLKDEDADRFLRQIPIYVDSIRAAIIQGAKGEANDQLTHEKNGAHPFYLELAADLYLGLLDDGKLAEAEDIGKTPREVLDRFLKYRSKEEIETLKVLSVAYSFDQDLFKSLVSRFHTGYPLTAFADFKEHSFLHRGQDGRYYIHALMKEYLELALDAPTFESVRLYLFGYYNGLLPKTSKEVNAEHEFFLQQAFRYMNWSNLEEAYHWYDDQIVLFYEAAKYALLIPIAFNILDYLNKNFPTQTILIAEMTDHLGRLYEAQGEYSKAEPFYTRALELRKDFVQFVEISERSFAHLGTGFNNLARLYEYLDRNEEALSLYSEALTLFQTRVPNYSEGIAAILNNVAEIFNKMGVYELAEPRYLDSLALYKRTLPDDHPNIANILNNLATLYRRQERYIESEALHKESLAIREKCRQPNHPEIANSLHNLALLYFVQQRYSEAKPLLLRATLIRKNTLPLNHPHLIESIKCLELIDSKMR